METKKLFSDFRPYQLVPGIAIADSIFNEKGLTFTVEIARQGGKNELSARMEAGLLGVFHELPQNIVKCSPTFMPQALISIRRLADCLNGAGLAGQWISEQGHIIRLGLARAIFLSADASASVVGNTAHLLLEVDEAQDVDKDKFNKEFKPMGAATNCTTVLYGTTWDDRTLLEEAKQANLELERRDGIKRHFRYDWQEVAKCNPAYQQYVEGERARLGENHPLFLTQYRLLPLRGGGGFLDSTQRAQLQGEHSRLRHPRPGKMYIAGLDLAGEAETVEDLLSPNPRRDAAVLTIAEVDASACNDIVKEPSLRVVEHYAWVGQKHPELYVRLADILKNVWRCKRVVVDATGVGEPVASFLRKALGPRVVPFHFTAQSKSQLGFNLLAAVNSGRLKVYKGDGTAEYREFMEEMEKARAFYRPSQTMNFFVDPKSGHDDYLMSLALAVEAGNKCMPKTASGREFGDVDCC